VYYPSFEGGKVMAKMKVGRPRGSPMPMHKEEKRGELQSRLKWLLSFLSEDIDSLSQVESYKLFLDFVVFVYGGSDVEGDALRVQIDEQETTGTRVFLNKTQHMLRRMLKWLQEGEERGGLRYEFPLYGPMYCVTVREDKIIKRRALHMLTPPIYAIYQAEKDERAAGFLRDMITDALIETLSSFPLSRVKTCQKPGCGNYFYQGTTRGGDYCSPKCRNWAKTNRWRQSHRDEYNKYHRNRRIKAREDRAEARCRSCGFQHSIGPIKDLIRGILSDINKCPTCGEMLLHAIWTWESGKWAEGEPLGSFEWEEFLKNEIPKKEG
jgi:hypothetical protein